MLYKTTKEFLLRFGLKDVNELPSMEEFEKMAALELSTDEEDAIEGQVASVAESGDLFPELENSSNGLFLGQSAEADPATSTPTAEPSAAPSTEAAEAQALVERQNAEENRGRTVKKEVPVTKKKAVKKSASTKEETQPSAPATAKTSARPKVLKTKASTAKAVAAGPVPVKAKAPGKTATAKAKAEEAESSLSGKPEGIVDSPVAAPATRKPAKKAAVKKAPKAEKGRDLVVDEPGAAEVAEVLHESPVKQDEELNTAEHPGPEPKLERLQKILARAGISSRRKAEELILGGQVQINGQVVTALGTKADASRDHVRVDGKLLQGPERIRYFVLNKPKGFCDHGQRP